MLQKGSNVVMSKGQKTHLQEGENQKGRERGRNKNIKQYITIQTRKRQKKYSMQEELRMWEDKHKKERRSVSVLINNKKQNSQNKNQNNNRIKTEIERGHS